MYNVQLPYNQFLIFVNDDQGHDHANQGSCDCGRGEVGQGHMGVNGIVKDEVCGEEEENCLGKGGRPEERNIWFVVWCYTGRSECLIINSMYDTV